MQAGRQAYVQLPYYEKNLSDLVEEGPLSMEVSAILMLVQNVALLHHDVLGL